MIKVGVVGLGKMGLSHLAMLRAHPEVEVAAVVDSTGYLLDVISKYTGLKTYSSYESMLASELELDAVVIATPTKMHSQMVKAALERHLAVFCEKPLCLTPAESATLVDLASTNGLVTQVGYHNRFVGAFAEVKRLLDANAIGKVTHVLAEAYGPVVLKPKGSTWRSRRAEGGGCLYDYAAHPLDLLSWYVGAPTAVGGTVLGSVFSAETDDEVFGTLFYPDGVSGQISVNWSDESYRKMTTKVTIWGTTGKIYADRQECQVYLRGSEQKVDGYTPGWNTRYTTELTPPVWFYLRGEEYSAQLDYFVQRVQAKTAAGLNDFRSAAATDRVLEMLRQDALAGPRESNGRTPTPATPNRNRRMAPQLILTARKAATNVAAFIQKLVRRNK